MSLSTELYAFDPFTADLLKPGQEFLHAVCETARHTFGSQVALIGSLRIAESERMYVQAVSKQNQDIELEYYDVCPAPCQRVLEEQRTIVYLEELRKLFPDDPGIRAFESRSYVGCPLLDDNGSSIGIIVLEWNRPLSRKRAQQVADTLETVAPRVAAEVVNHAMSRALDTLVQPLEGVPQDEFAVFRTIALQSASLAQVKAAFVGQCLPKDPERFRILSLVVDGEVLRDAEGRVLAYEGTPCKDLRDNEMFFMERGLQEAFPESAFYADMDLRSYFGYGFRSPLGQPIGHLGILHDRPMSERIKSSRILRTVSGRAKQELERYTAETERRSLEEALLNRKRLESLGLMAGTVAHDFNNQLMAIIGHTELAMLELAPSHPAMHSLKIAEDNLWRARDVIRDLMDFAGNTPKSPIEPVSLNEAIDHALALLSTDHLSSCQVGVCLEEGLPQILGRPAQLHQIIANILINAADAMDGKDGRLKVRTALLPIPDEERGKCLTGNASALTDPCVMLEISDNGRGMDPETARRAFDPFFSTKSKSRGLGLAGVLGIGRRMTASLTLDSQPGVGTTMRLYFRSAAESETRTDRKRPGSVVSERVADLGTILIVDDEPSVLETVAKQVRALGCRTIVASSGEEALARAKTAGSIQAAVIDVAMPGLDGWETLSELRDRFGQVPAVMMSGYNQSHAGERMTAMESVQVLAKPFPRTSLHATLTTMLCNRAAAEP